ncbi:hypothetical protein [Microbacterium maritypicum]|uniref:DUF4760 domain-containing protein n=1 Tax=Microbacterium maritypicum MF109 TaxID=1333857 RepID=T5KTP0_MICMQ|nr:hypothetical protein [Microbacterium liquefaciens]EQM83389.1 hypothetical protein L687_12275 [Microbacterium maritypicum MF109]
MDCDKYPISCELEQIARAISDSDASTFWLTLLATLVGAVAAGATSIALYRHELKTRNRGEIDVAVSELIREVQKYSQEYTRFVKDLRSWQFAEADRLSALLGSGPTTPREMPDSPAREGIDTAVEMLVVLTNGDDRRVAERCREVLYELNFLKDFEAQRVEYGSVRRVLVAWRARKRDADATIANLETIDERRRIIETGSDDPIPDAPEPYKRASE